MSSIRYQPLPSEESDVPAAPVHLTLVQEPELPTPAASAEAPAASAVSAEPAPAPAAAAPEGAPPCYAPPSYDSATTLPTYEEAERSKAQEAAAASLFPPGLEPHSDRRSREAVTDQDLLGSDMLFLLAFFMAFLFNWLGLMLAFCLSATLAARYGALSGFGLSMIKWFTIMRHTKYVELHEQYDAWLFWAVVASGLLLFVHGVAQYLRAKFMLARRQRLGAVLMQ